MLMYESDRENFWRVQSELVIQGVVTEGRITSDTDIESALLDQVNVNGRNSLGLAATALWDYAMERCGYYCPTTPWSPEDKKAVLAAVSWLEAVEAIAPYLAKRGLSHKLRGEYTTTLP